MDSIEVQQMKAQAKEEKARKKVYFSLTKCLFLITLFIKEVCVALITFCSLNVLLRAFIKANEHQTNDKHSTAVQQIGSGQMCAFRSSVRFSHGRSR